MPRRPHPSTTSAKATYGLVVTPAVDARSADPGGPLTYTFRVTNTGNVAATFGVSASGSAWSTDVPTTVGPVAPGDSADVEIVVHVPIGAEGGTIDVVAIAFAPQGGGDQSAVVTMTTSANVVCGVALTPPTDAESGLAGATITYTLSITNTGNLTDTFDVAVEGCSWMTTAPETIGPLGMEDAVTLEVIVSIPESALGGSIDTAVLTVTSQADETRLTSASLTTQVPLAEADDLAFFLPLIAG